MFKKSIISASLAAGLMLSAGLVHADGFHYKISNTARLVADADGKLKAVNLSWLYDAEVSAALMEDEDTKGAGRAEALKRRAGDILYDLADRGYFTNVAVDGGEGVDMKPVTEYEMDLTSSGNLKLNFVVTLDAPIDVKGKKVTLQVVDPDAVSTVTYANGIKSVALDDKLASSCGQPSLEKDTTDLPNEHKLTTETVVMTCK